MKRLVIAIVVALGIAACTRIVVLDPPPPDGSSALPDAVGGNDGGFDGGGGMDAGTIGDAALAD